MQLLTFEPWMILSSSLSDKNSICVSELSKNFIVYVLNEDGTVTFQKVELGRRFGKEYEVLSGLVDSATVVTGGQIRLKDGVKVNVK